MNTLESSMNGPTSEEEALFDAARRLTNPAQRQAFTDAVCAEDPALRLRLQNLLDAQSEADKFFEEGVATFGVSSSGGSAFDPSEAGTLNLLTEKPGDRIQRYKLLQQIGEGGCGVVYMAEQEEPVCRRVALKVIKLGMD